MTAQADAEYRVRILEEKLRDATKERDDAKYRCAIAEWALVGITRSSVVYKINDNSMSAYTHAPQAVQIAQVLGDQAARAIIYEARLAFNSHAAMEALRQHIHYLENHASSRGLPFRSWAEKAFGDLSMPNWTTWPKPFTGPAER